MKKFTLNVLVIVLTFITIGMVNAQDVVDLTAIDNPDILADTLPDLNSGAIVLLKPGMEYNAGGYSFDSSLTLQSSEPSNLILPKINCAADVAFGDGAVIDSLIFRNIEFFGTYDARYVINSNVTATVGKLMFDGCYMHDLRGILRMKDTGPGTLDNYVVNNCVITMIRDYGLLTVDVNTWICNNIAIQNSTFSKMRTFITSKNNTTSLLFDGCVLSEVPAAGQRFLRWRETGQDNITDGIMVKNTLWGTGWDETNTGSTAYDGYDGLGETTWTFDNVYATSDLEFAADKDTIKGFNYTYESLSTDLWMDLAKGNFLFADTTFNGIGNAGDQRWGIGTDDGGVEWNISADAFKALGTIDTTKKVAGLTIFASSAKTVVVDANNKSVDGMDFTHRMKLGGSGDFDANGQPNARVLSVDVMRSSTVTVAAMSSSGSADRILDIAFGHKDSLLAEFPALGASLTKADYVYDGGPTKLYFYSPSSGVNVYYLKVVAIPNTDATLDTLILGAGTLDPVFDPAVTTYTAAVPHGTDSVEVSATANDVNATVTGTGWVNLTGGSGTATVTVTAEDGMTTMDYVVDITVLPNNDATLDTLYVSPGTLNPVFDAGTTSYTVEVPQGTNTVSVSATATDPNATVTGTDDVDVSSGSGTASVVVTAEDGTTTITYTIDITVLTSIEDALANAIFVYPTVSKGIFNVEFTGKPGVITVYDLTGRLVEKRNADSKVETICIDEAGIYLFRIQGENECRLVRVVSVK
jgi:hypothetical protein